MCLFCQTLMPCKRMKYGTSTNNLPKYSIPSNECSSLEVEREQSARIQRKNIRTHLYICLTKTIKKLRFIS